MELTPHIVAMGRWMRPVHCLIAHSDIKVAQLSCRRESEQQLVPKEIRWLTFINRLIQYA